MLALLPGAINELLLPNDFKHQHKHPELTRQTDSIVTRVCLSACAARFRAAVAASKSVGMISGLAE